LKRREQIEQVTRFQRRRRFGKGSWPLDGCWQSHQTSPWIRTVVQ